MSRLRHAGVGEDGVKHVKHCRITFWHVLPTVGICDVMLGNQNEFKFGALKVSVQPGKGGHVVNK